MALQKYTQFWAPFRTVYFKEIKKVHWMNRKATPDKAYVPTTVEHVANVITHGIWILPSAYGSAQLLLRSKNWAQFWAAVIYGAALVLCFTVSTVFHTVFYCGSNKPLKELLHRSDRAMIYVFIAASYFPWLLLQPLPAGSYWTSQLWWVVWALAFTGIAYQQMFHEKYKTIETLIYMIVGAGPLTIVLNNKVLSDAAESQIILGGIVYIVGVLFFKSDGRIPCAHAVWHLFVAGAAAIHYYAVLQYLYDE